VFLPSFADTDSTVISIEDGCAVTIDGVPVESGTDCASYEIGRSYPLGIEGAAPKSLTFLRSDNVAALFVTTKEGDMDKVNADKEYKAETDVVLYTPEGKADYTSVGGDTISGRGNSTWKLDKKPYNLKLGQASDLLGMGSAKKWSLLANAYDETDLRNKLVLDFARDVAPYDGFAPECAFVDVYANGDYLGLYLICRSVSDVTAGFLDTSSEDAYEFELTMTGKLGEDDLSVPVNGSMSAEIAFPSPCGDAQTEQLAGIVAGLNVLARSDEIVSDVIRPDIESWARKLLIEVVFENYDGANASQYFWGSLKDGTVYAGPCWDYDLSMGIYYIDWSTPYAIMAFKDWDLGRDISWYHGMWEKPSFREYAMAVYKDVFRDRLSALLDERMPAEAEAVASAAKLDRIRWPGFYTKYDGFDEAVEDMTSFMRARIDFLDSLWVDGAKYDKVTMKLPNTRMLHLYALSGEVCKDIPYPCDVSLPGEGMDGVTEWYLEGTDELFAPDTPITEDIVLYARLPEEAR